MYTHDQKVQRNNDPDTHPCLKEADLSRKCLDMNHYLKEKCTVFFENYNNCCRFWFDIRAQRRLNGVSPSMPGEKERELIMSERKKGNIIYSAEIPQDEKKIQMLKARVELPKK